MCPYRKRVDMSYIDIVSGLYATHYPVFLTEIQETALKNRVSEAFMDLFDIKFGKYANSVSDTWYSVMCECVNGEVSYRQNHQVADVVVYGDLAMKQFINLYNTRS